MADADAHKVSDESLMVRVCNGDHQAFAALVERHTQRFYATAFRMFGNSTQAEDAVQDAFLKLWQKPQGYDPSKGAKFTTWFTRVVTNVAIDQMRKTKPQTSPDILEFMAGSAPLADEELAAAQKAHAVEEAIQALPERQKAALNLCFYEGLSNKEAAEILGVGVKALESLLMRAKTSLKESLVKEKLDV